uniref:Uncharacterized protein n=1 Tax=Strigamia maritima TaxID=126957 RepID=T1J6U4_STRMM
MEVDVKSHGNSKNINKPYYRTADSVKKKLYQVTGSTKSILLSVSKEEGELEAKPSHLARNKRQVLYEPYKKEIPKSIDPVFTISQLMQGKMGQSSY